MQEAKLYELAYNAHEQAEASALEAIYAKLAEQSVDALAVLADPDWRWETRGAMSGWIIDMADQVLNEKLDAAVGFNDSVAVREP